MKATTQADYHVAIKVNATAGKAAEAIGNVSGWWTENTAGSTKQAGDIFTVTFGETFVQFGIAEVTPGKRMIWQVQRCNLHWLNNKTE
jgi:hypothetical protein